MGKHTKANSPAESHFAKLETMVVSLKEGVPGEAGHGDLQQYLLALIAFLFVNYNR